MIIMMMMMMTMMMVCAIFVFDTFTSTDWYAQSLSLHFYEHKLKEKSEAW